MVVESKTPTLAMMAAADGSKIGVNIGGHPVRELGSDFVVMKAEDASNRIELSSNVLASEYRFRSLVDNALNLICECEGSVVTFVNKPGLTLLRTTNREDVVGKQVSTTTVPLLFE